MSKAIVLQHVEYEGPGRIVPAFRDYGIPIEVRRLYKGDEVPHQTSDIRCLIIMGGPMGVGDIAAGTYPFLEKEVELLQKMIRKDMPVLGICLGAQLLAHAAGAKVYPNAKPGAKPEDPVTPMPEIGWGPVTFPFPGGTEPLVTGMVDGAPMFHWHFDTFDLPKLAVAAPPPGTPPPATGNALLSSTKTCKNQAFRFKNRLFGFQYHFEMDEAGIAAMLTHAKDDVIKAHGTEGASKIAEDTKKFYPRYARLGDRIIGNYVQFLKVY